MAGTTRVPTAGSRTGAARQPYGIRPPTTRASSLAPPGNGIRTRSGTVSPRNGRNSAAASSRPRSPEGGGVKRKERDFEYEGEETNIHVVVRCRGRNDREVRENSGVVVATEGARGTTVDLSMGPNALSNKTYHFDKVFSQAADQAMVYEDVVAPVLDDMLNGYNCTVFAYGQTGTGKTYTMTGDMTESMGLLSDAAGIIPRVLCSLFRKLDADGSENSVKCSFIELYNEELRDLLSSDDHAKLKLFEDGQKKGHTATIVQGMEESHINSAAEGIKLLRAGSHKRQVAATKCNDLSSRSHTVFTITLYLKTTAESGEEYVAAGKLNLVDLAGSENIQRSGAEHKRAAEAGLINKSLLTLGRVINALVDHSAHIPYRESKLTRLLQDSLGGRTKTCIIATLSPAKSNLEETISTLDYAFRAKNIRNKPQVNPLISKKTLLREFTVEIEKLKSELIATRQRNGVYLTNEAYEQMTTESESRRILSDEQKATIETMEANLRNKVQELFALTNGFALLKKDIESTRNTLNETDEVLKQTEIVLADTRQNLADEALLRKAHQATEEELLQKGGELITTLDRTVKDVNGLHAKLKRKSDVQSINRTNWTHAQSQIGDITAMVEECIRGHETHHRTLIEALSHRVQAFVAGQVEATASKTMALTASLTQFEQAHATAISASSIGKDQMNNTLEEIKVLREEVKEQVGKGLQELSTAAGRIAKEVIEEMETLHTQLHGSYNTLGQEFKSIFEQLTEHANAQKTQAEALRVHIDQAASTTIDKEEALGRRMNQAIAEERQHAAVERQTLLSQITELINANGAASEKRLATCVEEMQGEVADTRQELEKARSAYNEGMAEWALKETLMQEQITQSRDAMKIRLKTDWTSVSEHNARIQGTTRSIHGETVRIVEQQMEDMATQMQTLDEFVTKARGHNDVHHEERVTGLGTVATTAQAIHALGTEWLADGQQRTESLAGDLQQSHAALATATATLDDSVCGPLADLRDSICEQPLQEYSVTGATPRKMEYTYPLALPQTAPHNELLGRTDTLAALAELPELPDLSDAPLSPSKAPVFADATVPPRPATADGGVPSGSVLSDITSISVPASSSFGLREIAANAASVRGGDDGAEHESEPRKVAMGPPPLKRHATESARAKGQGRGRADRENLPVALTAGTGGGRRLRSSPQNR